MQIQSVFPGSYYISEGGHAILAGCPPEIIKALLQRKLPTPQHLLLPDVAVSQGESQVAVEFPLYHHLFFSGANRLPPPLNLVGSARRVKAAVDLLELTLFGPSEEQMQEWGMAEDQSQSLAREIRWFQLKDDQGKVLPIEALVTKTIIGDEPADLGWVKIKRLRPNVFQLCPAIGETVELDLTVDCEQTPPYPVATDLLPTTLVKMGIEILGGGTGFSTTQASCGLALCFNGQYLLIDAIPYLQHHLLARGIARNQIHALFLSHIHDDHCNLASLLLYNRRISVLTTPVVYHMMLHKLALLLDRSEESLQDYFVFVPLTPGEETNYFGLRITPLYSSHSIPTLGAAFETVHDGVNYRVVYTADNQSLTDLRRMQKTGVVNQERFQEVAAAYRKPAHLLIADGGEGAIHGDPADALESPAERVVFLHLDKLSERFNAQFTTASAGKRFNVLHGDTDYHLTRTIEYLLEYFPDMPPMWISHLLANQHIHKFNAGDIIIREGVKSDGRVYMILTGHVDIIHHDGGQKHYLARMEAGEIIGEMSIIIGQGTRNASVVAKSPAIVTAFSETAFREYVHHQNLEGRLKKLWQHRELLQTLPYLRVLQQPVIRELAKQVTLEHLPARSGPKPLKTICDPFSLVMPLGLEVALNREGKPMTLAAHAAPILCQPGVTLVTETEFHYLLLGAEQAADLRARIPAFRYYWEEMLGLALPNRVRF
jgi:hypothetical protein